VVAPVRGLKGSAPNLQFRRPMKLHTNTGVDDREEWRARILRALKELRSDESSVLTRGRHEESGDDPARSASAKL